MVILVVTFPGTPSEISCEKEKTGQAQISFVVVFESLPVFWVKTSEAEELFQALYYRENTPGK